MSAPARVLIVTQYFWPEIGAPQVRYAAIARTLAAIGLRVDVLTGVPNYPTGRIRSGYDAWTPQAEEHAGAHIHRLPLFAYGGRARWLRLLNHASFSASAFAGVVMDLQPDLVVVESPPPTLVLAAALIARRNRAPLVMYCADLWPAAPLALGVLRPGFIADRLADLESLCYRLAWRIVVPTDGLYATLAGHPDAGAAKLLMLPNGVDTHVFHPYPEAECQAQRGRVAPIGDRALFTYAGTLGPVHALDTLFDAATLLRHDPRIGFVILGDGPERERLETKVAALGLGNVVFVGGVPPEELARFLAISRAAISPLRDHPLFASARSAQVLPSLACATPVIFAGRGETAAMIEREACGVVVTPEEPAALATAIQQLTERPDDARDMGKRGRVFAVREFDFSALVRRWWDETLAALARTG